MPGCRNLDAGRELPASFVGAERPQLSPAQHRGRVQCDAVDSEDRHEAGRSTSGPSFTGEDTVGVDFAGPAAGDFQCAMKFH